MDIPIPRNQEDITKQWLEKMLGRHGDVVEVVNFKIDVLSGKADNFLSQMFMVHIDGTENDQEATYDFVIKILPLVEFQMEQAAEMQVFDKEIQMYLEVVPAMVACQKQDGSKVVPPLPKCYFAKLEGKLGVLVLENLKTRGYEMLDIKTGLNQAEAEEVMKTFAVYHALGYNLQKSLGAELLEKFPTIDAKPFLLGEEVEMMMNTMIDQVCRVLQAIPGQEANVDKISTSSGKVMERMQSCWSSQEPFATIAHGDAWSNNVMFNMDAGNKEYMAMLIDLQVGYFGTPTGDLSEIIASSAQPSVQANIEQLLRIYYDTFMNTLEKLEISANFSLEELVAAYKKNYFVGFIKSTFPALMFGILDKEEIAKMVLDIKCKEEEQKMVAEMMGGTEIKVQSLKDRLLKSVEDSITFGTFPV